MMKRRNGRLKCGIRKQQRTKASSNSYEKMMKTLLLQNQQIIIQQQNMMFMVMRQYQHQATPIQSNHQQNHHQQQQPQQEQQPHHLHPAQPQPQSQQQQTNSHQHQQQHHLQAQQQEHHNIQIIQHHITQDQSSQQSQHQLYSQATSNLDTDHQLQQVATQLQESLGNYLTPAQSEQDPINDKPEDDDLVALLEGDGLLHNNLLYNPQTDIGSVTPYKNHQQTHQTPSYYSSGCESLSTPRVETQKQPTTTNISQNVVKNLADSFKSPTKPKINVQIMSAGSATGSMKNSKAKIIQRMNISEFLRHVHPETDENQKNAS